MNAAPRLDAFRRLRGAIVCVAVCAGAAAFAQEQPKSERRYVRALCISDDATRVAAMGRGTPVRLMGRPEGAQKEILAPSSIEDIRASGFIAGNSLFLLSGYGARAAMTVVSRVTDGVDVARVAPKEGEPASPWAELANGLCVPSADGMSICRLSASGELELFDARTGRRHRKVRPDCAPTEVLAFPLGGSVIVRVTKCELARVDLADGRTVWKSRIRRVDPGISDDELESKNGDVDSVSRVQTVPDADRLVIEGWVSLPRWRGLVVLELTSGKEVWRRALDIEHVVVCRTSPFVGLADAVTGWMAGYDLKSGELAGQVRLPVRHFSAVGLSGGSREGVAASGGVVTSFTFPETFEPEDDAADDER